MKHAGMAFVVCIHRAEIRFMLMKSEEERRKEATVIEMLEQVRELKRGDDMVWRIKNSVLRIYIRWVMGSSAGAVQTEGCR